jgi:putative photosynthetic complex assembly protein 2
MVSWSGHIVPVIGTIAIWFLATGLIAWLDNRERATFPRSLAFAGLAGVAGLVAILVSAQSTSTGAVYLAFTGALMVWSWHELAFLTGAVAGPRREACPPGSSGLSRFFHASAAVLHHEIALALTALLLIALSWNAPNQIGAMVFALLFTLRLSAKLNMFAGVPNASTDILPPHLDYLKSYFGPNRFTPLLAITIPAIVALATLLGWLALAAEPGSAAMTGASLLFALAALGAIEHLFFALPFRDGALWGWALPTRKSGVEI